MAVKKVTITTQAYFGDKEIDLSFPDNWCVEEYRMVGHGRPSMTDGEIREALRNPIESPRLSELAVGKGRVCIIFDDLPKPTRTYQMIPHVIEELHAGGIADESIRFLCAPGTHRPLTYPEIAAKLGADVVDKYLVFNHSVWDNLVYKGETSRGTPVYINREFDSADLRIGIGSIFPHPSAGFGGGAKLVLPGVSGMKTIEQHHRLMRENTGFGRLDDNTFRLDIEESARLAGLTFKADVVVNEKREAVALFCGDFVAEHRAGCKLAKELYRTETAKDADVVVANTYPDEPQMGRGHWVISESLKEGGDAVVITHSHEGQNLHQLNGRFGTDYGGPSYKPKGGRYPHLAKAGRVIIMAPFLSKYDREDAGPAEKVVWCKTWGEVLAELASRHGPGTRVAVYPYSPLQMKAC